MTELADWTRADSQMIDNWIREERAARSQEAPALSTDPDPYLYELFAEDRERYARGRRVRATGARAPEGRVCQGEGCGKPLCTRDYPVEGAVRHRGHGMCVTCYYRKWPERRLGSRSRRSTEVAA